MLSLPDALLFLVVGCVFVFPLGRIAVNWGLVGVYVGILLKIVGHCSGQLSSYSKYLVSFFAFS